MEIRSALPLQMQPVSKKCKRTAPPPLIQRRRGGIFVSTAGVRCACAFYVSLFPVRDKVLNYCRPRHRCEDELRRTLRLIALFPLLPCSVPSIFSFPRRKWSKQGANKTQMTPSAPPPSSAAPECPSASLPSVDPSLHPHLKSSAVLDFFLSSFW